MMDETSALFKVREIADTVICWKSWLRKNIFYEQRIHVNFGILVEVLATRWTRNRYVRGNAF